MKCNWNEDVGTDRTLFLPACKILSLIQRHFKDEHKASTLQEQFYNQSLVVCVHEVSLMPRYCFLINSNRIFLSSFIIEPNQWHQHVQSKLGPIHYFFSTPVSHLSFIKTCHFSLYTSSVSLLCNPFAAAIVQVFIITHIDNEKKPSKLISTSLIIVE